MYREGADREPNGEGIVGEGTYDVIIAGTGFASTFFLHRYLRTAPEDARVLVLERGRRHDHRFYVDGRDEIGQRAAGYVENRTPEKPWVFTVGFGGGSNCWWACTPRMLPEDFELRTRYGVGDDWPLSYDELESYYCDAEELLAISGDDRSPVPRSRPYPQPPHRLSSTDEALRRAHPDSVFPQPTARARRRVEGGRGACCANGTCAACPVDAKFTVSNGMMGPYRDPRVDLRTSSEVRAVEHTAGVATGVRVRRGGEEVSESGDLVVLGTNAIFNAAILLRSGLDQGPVGEGLVEQTALVFDVDVDGIDGFDGSTSITAHCYELYGGTHRADHAAGLIELWNVPQRGLRIERGRYRQKMEVKVIYEELRDRSARVDLGSDRPSVGWTGLSPYTSRALARGTEDVARVLEPLPVEEVRLRGRWPTEAHVLGTTVMGSDPATSVIDADQVHHRIRNLVVAGGGAFPTAAPANPTLTIAALTLRGADRLLR